MEPVRARRDAIIEGEGSQYGGTPHRAAERRGPIGFDQDCTDGRRVMQERPFGDDPAIVGDELIANRRRRHRRGDESGNQYGLSSRYSHSIVAGGLELTSYATRFTPRTSLMMRLEILPRTSCGNGNQSAGMPSRLVTARSATT